MRLLEFEQWQARWPNLEGVTRTGERCGVGGACDASPRWCLRVQRKHSHITVLQRTSGPQESPPPVKFSLPGDEQPPPLQYPQMLLQVPPNRPTERYPSERQMSIQ